MDSVKAYFGRGIQANLEKFIQSQVKRAEKIQVKMESLL